MLLARSWFKVTELGNWFVLTGFAVLGTLAFVYLGYIVGSFVRTEEASIPLLQLLPRCNRQGSVSGGPVRELEAGQVVLECVSPHR